MPNAESDHIRFRIPLETMSNAMTEIGSFPYAPGETKWDGRTLFIKGEKSKWVGVSRSAIQDCMLTIIRHRFINRHYLQPMKDFFPNMKLDSLDAGHWGEFDSMSNLLTHRLSALFSSSARWTVRLFLPCMSSSTHLIPTDQLNSRSLQKLSLAHNYDCGWSVCSIRMWNSLDIVVDPCPHTKDY